MFMVDERIPYVLAVKNSNFFNFLRNLCTISKIALVKYVWLIFKLDFDLNDVYWI
jgi:hypothetical protein